MGRFPELQTSLSRDFRNSYNEGTKKIDDSINKVEADSTTALSKALIADVNASTAKTAATQVKEQLNNLILENGDSTPEIVAMRTDQEGNTFPTAGDRLDNYKKQLDDTSKERNRQRNTVRRNNTGRLVRVPLSFYSQYGFTYTDAPINIFSDGISFYTDFDPSIFMPASVRTLHANVLTGQSTNDGLSESAPKKSLFSAYANANAGDTISITNESDVIYREGLWESQQIKKSIKIIGKRGRRRKLVNADKLIYTKEVGYNYVYSATRSGVADVVDFTIDDLGVRYQKVSSITECDNIKGSWYQNGSLLYVHAFNDKVPTEDKVFALLTTPMFHVVSDERDIDLYFENFDVIGGHATGNIMLDRRGFKINLYEQDIRYLHTTGLDGNADSINADGVDRVFSRRVICAHSNKDGFNYTRNNSLNEAKTPGRFIEVDCEGFICGVGNKIPGSDNTHNGTTAHSGVKGIRVNGSYHDTVGVPVCDVQAGTESLNLGTYGFDPLSKTKDIYDACFSTQQSGSLMILDGCVAFGGGYDIYSVTGSNMVVLNTEFNTKQGGGTFNIVNQM